MLAIFWLIDAALGIYWFFVIASVILSWLVAFNVINTYQPFVQTATRFLYNVTEPVVGKIRRFMPDLGGVDLSPLVLLLLIHFTRILLRTSIAPVFGVYGY
ncbi:YggT family protein [Kordiimonas sp. SCSIO 12610]|uniref:YggT family protein n=1 Tax=Kordiimonas sp. SCSIO 12610 TaxID=2829597 RepID=UPI00210DA897|nr:YggT family protein [Kordiimonas sp. SCSIO 12610]UTW55607.1 YggT family protein [Kordiimonas sp. SCSIO 12610]